MKILLKNSFIMKGSSKDHNHGPSSALLAVERAESAALQAALVSHSTSTARSLQSAVSSTLHTSEMMALGSTSKALEMRLQRGKMKMKKFPAVPNTYEGLVLGLPKDLALTHTGSPLLRYLSIYYTSPPESSLAEIGINGNAGFTFLGIVWLGNYSPLPRNSHGFITDDSKEFAWLMVSDEGLRALNSFKIYSLDGTFDCAPSPFKQIFCINVVTNSRMYGKLGLNGTWLYALFYWPNSRPKCPGGVGSSLEQVPADVPRGSVPAAEEPDDEEQLRRRAGGQGKSHTPINK